MRRSLVAVPATAMLALWACDNGSSKKDPASQAKPAAGASADLNDPKFAQLGAYVQRNLVSSEGGPTAEHTDAHLVNSWGLDALPTSPWWVANADSNTSTLYDGEGVAQFPPTPLVVDVPGAGTGAGPTGLVANPTTDFVITMGGATGPARFLFAGEDGTIDAWMPTDPISTSAVKVVDATAGGAIFKGLAMASTSSGSRLYATDFHNARVWVWDSTFHEVTLGSSAFQDARLPMGFAPFGIRVIRDVVLVTYAMQDDSAEDDVPGPGQGFVNAYSKDGRLLARIVSRGKLNAPWGLALAPSGFGPHSLRLLVGNFGDGRVVSYGVFEGDGSMRGDQAEDLDDDGADLLGEAGPLEIDGLWALSFGTGGTAGPATALFFTSGPDDEAEGLFGRIDAAAP
jgi:uncharacterized protein (TIGR03118 family)